MIMMMIKTTVIMMWCRIFLVLSERNYVELLSFTNFLTWFLLLAKLVHITRKSYASNFKFYCCCFILMFLGWIIKLDVCFVHRWMFFFLNWRWWVRTLYNKCSRTVRKKIFKIIKSDLQCRRRDVTSFIIN